MHLRIQIDLRYYVLSDKCSKIKWFYVKNKKKISANGVRKENLIQRENKICFYLYTKKGERQRLKLNYK